MALEVRRIVTGHDANGKAVIKTDERLPAVSRLGRPHIAGCEIWSTDRMPADNSEASEAAQRKGFVTRYNYVGTGQGTVIRITEFAPRRAQIHAPYRDRRLCAAVVGRVRPRARQRRGGASEGGRCRRPARHDARLGQPRAGTLCVRFHPDRRQAGHRRRSGVTDPFPRALTVTTDGGATWGWVAICGDDRVGRLGLLHPRCAPARGSRPPGTLASCGYWRRRYQISAPAPA